MDFFYARRHRDSVEMRRPDVGVSFGVPGDSKSASASGVTGVSRGTESPLDFRRPGLKPLDSASAPFLFSVSYLSWELYVIVASMPFAASLSDFCKISF